MIEVIAYGQLAAKGVPSSMHTHRVQLVIAGLDQDRDIEFGQIKGLYNAQFIPEIRQDHNDTVNLIPMGLKQGSTFLRVGIGFDGSVIGGIGR